MKKKEESLQIAVSKYIQLKYPDVIFTSESSGIRLTINQAVKLKQMRSSKGLPDMIILEPRGQYSGLMLELKKDGQRVFTKGGKPYSGRTVIQNQILSELMKKGFYSRFAIGLDHAIAIIDEYMRIGCGVMDMRDFEIKENFQRK